MIAVRIAQLAALAAFAATALGVTVTVHSSGDTAQTSGPAISRELVTASIPRVEPVSTHCLSVQRAGMNYIIKSADEFRGLYIQTDNGEIEILEIEWGTNRSLELAPVFLKWKNAAGQVFETDRRFSAVHVYADLAELRWFYLVFPQPDGSLQRMWTSEVTFASIDGRLTTVGFKGTDGDGQVVELIPQDDLIAQAIACQYIGYLGCQPFACVSPATCPSFPPCNCSEPSGLCDEVYLQRCPSAALCPWDKHCKIQSLLFDCY